ncbi:MAG TPA: DUF4397 domain-containing protein [Gemmatimonadaceae bacterium]|nr:DUF4397 domain-containing protein [Gemmatimonadaceae bacterium]
MRRKYMLPLLCIAAGVTACSTPDVLVPTEDPLFAGVRFINAVPDTGAAYGLNMHFVDRVESNFHYHIGFRNGPTTQGVAAQVQYKGAREGSRLFKVFLDDTVQAVAQTVLAEQTVTLTKGHNYTAMMWGNARSTGADAMRLDFWEETVADPGAGKVALRVINATGSPIDVRAYTGTATVVQTGTPTWAAVPAYSASNYVIMDTTAWRYNVRAAGGATNLFADVQALQGVTPTCSNVACKTGEKPDIDAAPGTRVSGSAVTGIVFPASVAGSRATQFSTPGLAFTWDRRPAVRICDPLC